MHRGTCNRLYWGFPQHQFRQQGINPPNRRGCHALYAGHWGHVPMMYRNGRVMSCYPQIATTARAGGISPAWSGPARLKCSAGTVVRGCGFAGGDAERIAGYTPPSEASAHPMQLPRRGKFPTPLLVMVSEGYFAAGEDSPTLRLGLVNARSDAQGYIRATLEPSCGD